MNFARLNEFVHEFLRPVIRPGDTVVDATVGNGADALFLAEAVGPKGVLYGFDIQPVAIAATKERLLGAGIGSDRFRLLRASHTELGRHVVVAPRVIMFNLGYRPGGDVSITTGRESTLTSLNQSLEVLVPGGVISLMLYRGHPGGREETAAVLDFAAGLPGGTARVLRMDMINLRNDPPSLLFVQKMR